MAPAKPEFGGQCRKQLYHAEQSTQQCALAPPVCAELDHGDADGGDADDPGDGDDDDGKERDDGDVPEASTRTFSIRRRRGSCGWR